MVMHGPFCKPLFMIFTIDNITGLGTGDTAALHATTFNFDEEILLKGADFFESLAENFQ